MFISGAKWNGHRSFGTSEQIGDLCGAMAAAAMAGMLQNVVALHPSSCLRVRAIFKGAMS